MPRTTKPLTNIEVKQAKPKEKEYCLFDGNGLALRIRKNGTKQWVFSYKRPYTKKQANVSFGSYPSVSLAQAREFKEQARALLLNDIDPQEHKQEQHQKETQARENTFELVAAKWLEVKKASVKADTANDIWRSLELHIFPELGKVPIHKLQAATTIKVLEPIAAKGTLETVKRLIQRINEVMIFATNTGIIKQNPLAGIGKAFQAPKKENLPTIKPDELPELMSAIQNASIKRTTRHLIEWQLHTMTRPSEAAGTRWDEIDLDNALWHIPGERMKKGIAHTIPLSNAMMDLLQMMKDISGHREHVFPADRDPTKHANSSTANMALKRMGYHGKLVSHGLRSLASTTLNEQEFSPDVIEAALAHKDSNEVRAAYNRAEYIQKRRVMMEHWSQHILEAQNQGNTYSISKKSLKLVI